MSNILIVDDDKNLRALLEQELSDEGHEITTMPDGGTALSYLQRRIPDIIILDISMPGMDGLQVLQRIREQLQKVPVILHSAYSTYIDNVCSMPASAYVVKSGDLSGLLSTVNDLLSKQAGALAVGENI